MRVKVSLLSTQKEARENVLLALANSQEDTSSHTFLVIGVCSLHLPPYFSSGPFSGPKLKHGIFGLPVICKSDQLWRPMLWNILHPLPFLKFLFVQIGPRWGLVIASSHIHIAALRGTEGVVIFHDLPRFFQGFILC